MNTESRIIIPYSGNSLEHADWAQGASLFKKSIRKGKIRRITPLTTQIKKTRNRVILFFILGLIALWLAFPMFTGKESRSMLYCMLYAAVITYEFGCLFFCLLMYITMKRLWKRIQKSAELPSSGGRLIFDDYGIEDTTNEGTSTRLPWSAYEMCAIAGNTLVIMMSGIYNYVPADEETVQAILETLTSYGKADTIFDCREKM